MADALSGARRRFYYSRQFVSGGLKMSSPALPLSDIVDVVVLVSPQAASAPTFNHGLIFGNTTGAITHAQRIIQVTSAAQLITAGYTTSSPEYIAAEIYFSQSPAPLLLWVGFQDPTSLKTVIPHSGNAGTNYIVGDIVTVVQGGASGGECTVATIGGGGAVTGLAVVTLNDGTGYAVASALSTTGGSGTGLEVDISAVGETPLLALENLRAINADWYGCMSTTAVTADHEAIALFVQSCQPPAIYFYYTADANVPTGGAGNVFAYMKANSYSRAFGQYATTQGGAASNNVYAGAAAMGVAMGLNTGLANSYFTMFGKGEVGITAEPLNATQLGVINGASLNNTGNNGNVLSNFANAYTLLWKGTMGNGQYLDLILFLDVLTAQIQYNVMNLLVSQPAV